VKARLIQGEIPRQKDCFLASRAMLVDENQNLAEGLRYTGRKEARCIQHGFWVDGVKDAGKRPGYRLVWEQPGDNEVQV